ncbi:MAG: alpha/beta hydrolase family protein [Bryobacteraceae bacterium]
MIRYATIALLSAALLLAQEVRNPEQPGPYPVGVTSMQLDDASRTDPELGSRPLRTEVWYPAADAARSMPKNKYSDFILRGVIPGSMAEADAMLNGFRKGLTVAELDRTFSNISVRDAPVREGKWPLIVFSHGSGGTRFAYVYFTEFMASHGYIVMAPDHVGNSRFTIVNGQVVKAGGARGRASALNRPKDMSFMIDAMTWMDRGADSRFTGRIDLDQVAAAGMSFGGSTTQDVIDHDKRVKAAVMLAPGGPTGDRTNFTTPVLMMIATEDATLRAAGNARDRAYYQACKGPHYLVEIRDAGHHTFTSVEQYNPNFGDGIGRGRRVNTAPDEDIAYLPPHQAHQIIDAYALAFLNVYARGEQGYREFLRRNHYGPEIVYKFGE